MDTLTNGLLQLGAAELRSPGARHLFLVAEGVSGPATVRPKDPELLRRVAWEIGENRPAEAYHPAVNHVGLAMVTPSQGFAHWHILHDWVDGLAREKGPAWQHCRLILRLYDVSYIEFDGMNAHRLRDYQLSGLSGQMSVSGLPAGTWQLGEVGFLLRSGEFLAAARSPVVAFPRTAGAPQHSNAGLYISSRGRVEEIGNVWEQEHILRERARPQLRQPLRIAAFSFAAQALGHDGVLAQFVSELAAGQASQGHEAHVFLPGTDSFTASFDAAGVHYHPLEVGVAHSPVARAEAFRQAALDRLHDFPAFDLIHLHEWMTGLAPRLGHQPLVLSLGSLESTRRNGTPPDDLSRSITEAEREAARSADCVLTPHWLHERALAELEVDGARIHAFPMEGRMPNEWESPLDCGEVKKGIGLGPLDRLLLYVGPLEHAAGVDLLVEALPVLLNRAKNVRMVCVGTGSMHGAMEHRAHQLGVGGCLRLLGDVAGYQLTRLLRASEALVLPSRCRIRGDDGVIDLARRAGRPVVTTHSGPGYLVKHEETGVITYDNPGSLVWAMDRILGDSGNADRMGRNGRRTDVGAIMWSDVARHYMELCATNFPELTETKWE
jgi:glycosyltransferase involved in cell wall biosynthesis